MDKDTKEYRDVKVEIIFQNKAAKTFRFCNDDTVWIAKQTVLLEFSSLNLTDPLNYGFYMPPLKGKAGKFLDEERVLRDYPAESYGDHLEFRYKRRIYRGSNTDEKKLQKYQSKSYQKKFFDYLVTGSLDRAKKLLEKGLDPNFQIDSTGETPLTAMSALPNSAEACMMLIGNGAYLDYRAANGLTALHKAVINVRDENIAFLLDLGASPNYKDAKGLTPLWHGLLTGASDHCCELLLNERADLGVTDQQGCKEIHIACRQGLDRHLEHLIFYGANLNSRTATGNTALHLCAIGNQENCARILLFRGADRTVANYGNQTAQEVAIVSGNSDIATLIHDFDSSQVTPFVEKPNYSRRRREPKPQSRTLSPSPKVISSQPPIPEHNEVFRSVTVANKAELDDHRESREAMFVKNARKASNNNLTVVTESDKKHPESDESGSEFSDSDDEMVNKHKKVDRRTFSTGAVGKKAPAPIKSGPGTKAQLKSRLYSSIPGRQFVAVVDYRPRAPGELALEKGDAVEVLYIGEQGFWEGRVNERTGWFPSSCIQELKKVNKKEKNRTWFGKKSNQKDIIEKCAKPDKPMARMVHLKKGDRGFGFQLRGANSHTARIEFTPSVQFPALQYIGEVDKGGVAEKVGLKAGDFVIEVNGENVANATHGYVVSLVANTGKALTMKVVTVSPETVLSLDLADGPQNVPTNHSPTPIETTSVKAATPKNAKKAPPPPLPRSQYSSMTVGNLSSGVVLSEVHMSANVDTVMTLDKKVQRKRSVKSMWSDTAWKLHPESIRTEEISKGVARKSKGMSVSIPKEQEGEIGLPGRSNSISSRSSASSPNINNAVPFATLPRRLSRSSSQTSDETDSQNRPAVPPTYETTLENMRRLGRKPSFKRSESEKKLTVSLETTTETKPRTVSTCSDVFPPPPFPEAPSYSPPPPPVEEQQHISRSMSVPPQSEVPPARTVTRTASEPTKEESPSSEEDEPASDFAKALRQVAAARKQRTRTSKLSIDDSITMRKKEQSLQVIKENEESTKTFHNMPKSSSSDAILQNKENKGLDHHNLYAASSTSSLDTQASKDSGIDVSDIMSQAPGEQPPDLASALANAVARRAEKIAKKDPITKPAEQKDIAKNSPQMQHEFHGVRLKPTQNVTGTNPSGSTNQAAKTSAPPPTRPKPPAKLPPEKLSDETASVPPPEKKQDEAVEEKGIKNEILTPPLMFASLDNVNESHEIMDDLPSPPLEFVSINESLRNDKEKTQPMIGTISSTEPPPPYSPPRVKSDLPSSISAKPFPEWTSDEVGQWLDFINMGQYKESFVENDIQGAHLSELSKDDLSELGVKKLGHRLTIDDAIGKLRSQLQYSEV